jgi:hypothetical protein
MLEDDDRTISDEEHLFRRVHKNWIVEDSNLNELRPTSQAFQNYSGQNAFSVSIESVLSANGMDATSVIVDSDQYAMVSLKAGLVRQQQQGVQPHPEKDDPSHAHVVGNKSGAVKKAFKLAAEWVTPLEHVKRLKQG